ncbi:class I SAM-dependent methyltransferase [Sabulilitoribacter arenilitoris]|uniref:Class I SAM-dependent methyltransferase n=1 Tax=Wocania arenilitoris TaxID=2044858 RepID=A0AAE3JK45_9FLAO|nr:class I SAM-dependent methyltransferase [Wocania arenilitoris]MCF7566754.1 class I SAM-dependent methyltransferase [Wocania arenilitoris]
MDKKFIFLNVKDHSVSGERFELIPNSEYDFLETTPQPSLDKLPEYYISEDYISHTDSKRNLFEKAYHLVRSISLKKKLNLINAFAFRESQCKTLEEKTLLDVGCGTGDFLEIAKKNNWQVSGIEPNNQAREIANKKTNNSVFETDKLLIFDANSFDVITLWHVLEHLPNLEDHVSIFKKLLKPNGALIIAVPNYKSYDAKYYKQFWAAYDVPRHLWHFNQASISKLVSKQSFKVEKVKPMWFDSFYVSMLSEKYKSGKMNPIKGIWIGLLSNIKAIYSKEASSLIYIIKNS